MKATLSMFGLNHSDIKRKRRGGGSLAPFPLFPPDRRSGLLGRLCEPGRQESNVLRFERCHLSFRRAGSQPPTTTPQRTKPNNFPPYCRRQVAESQRP